jgi:Xaa-Pro aminopeptidase
LVFVEEDILDYVPKEEIAHRIERMQQGMGGLDVDGCLITHDMDLYYFTGTLQNSVLWIPAKGNPILGVKKSLDRAKRESPLESLVPLRSYRQLPEMIGSDVLPSRVGMELDVIPVFAHGKLREALGGAETVDVSPVVRRVRAVKSDYEMSQLQKAADIHKEVFSMVPSLAKEGMTELELAIQLEGEYRRRGLAGPTRVRAWNQDFHWGVVSAGESANYPTSFDGPDGSEGVTPAAPQVAGLRKISRKETLIVDLLSGYNGYIVDMTRIYAFGEIPAEAYEAHRLAVEIQEKAASRLKPGEIPDSIYQEAKATADASPWGDVFMGFGDNQVSFIGHGVGLELDEFPVIAKRFTEPLAEGMVVAIEPKFFMPRLGAVGIEDTFVVEKGGGRKLTEFPTDIHILG